MNMEKIKSDLKIMLVDDHVLVRQGLKRVLDKEPGMSICSEAANADDAIRILADSPPDIIIIDISLEGDVDGIELVRAVRKRFGNIKILILSMFDEAAYVERAIRAGANGYVTKNDPLDIVSSAIKSIAAGDLYLSTSISGKVIKKIISSPGSESQDSYGSLTQRELEILELIGKGNVTGEIAKLLGVSVNTVESHRRHIKEKMGIKKGSDLLKHAIQWMMQKEKG